MRALILVIALLTLPLAAVRAQSAVPPAPTISVTPVIGDLTSTHDVHIEHAPVGAALMVLIDPDGNQTVYHEQTDPNGALDLTLAPSQSEWRIGLYRIALSLPAGASISAIFAAGNGQPYLFVGPNSPSPTSALNIVGIGLPPNTNLTLHLMLTGGNLGERDLHAPTDVNGIFSVYVWPGQVGVPFFPAGSYRVDVPEYSLSASFVAREHPLSATISIDDVVQPRVPTQVHFIDYMAGRYIWGVYAGPDGVVGGEFLVGPTDVGGRLVSTLTFPDLGAGQAYVGTPYDWGEASFTMVEPTATATPKPTATARPTVTPTPKPKAVKRCCPSKKKCKQHAKKARYCKRK